MKPYNVLIKRDSSKKIEDLVVVKEGFSIMAFLFGVFWFFYHRLFKEALILILVIFVIQQITIISSDFDNLLIEISLAVMIAINANYWLCNSLKSRGYEFIGMIYAQNLLEAKADVIKDFDKKSFSDKYLDPRLDKTPHLLKKAIEFFNKIR